MPQKKIAILTQPLKSNYGGIIQNFALQKVLKENGFNVTTVDRDYKEYSKFKLTLNLIKRKLINIFKGNKQFIISYKNKKNIFSNSSYFIDNNINRTKKIRSTIDLKKHFEQNKYDAVIVGSDQVWRPMYSPNIYNYFFDFLEDNQNIKKISYAASFGTDKWEFTNEQTVSCKKLVKQFDLITVREKSAINLVKDHFSRNAQFVIDPTLLIDKQEYINLISSKTININYKGIYTYVLDRNEEKNIIINKIENDLGLTSFFCQPKCAITNPISKNIDDYKYPPMEEWLNGFYSADFVITDSFHGTVFSIIFNKPFIAIVNKERGASRFESLLSELGLLDRLIYNFSEKEIDNILSKSINFEEVNSKIQKLKLKSLELLLKEL
ncbi:polysaccharide pyruvyl transferase family protein [Faecalibacter bovis]|uniref:Polysaccharide pyruvyl transferase family protein n=1 Tax=Faecalibacter bovis TaxID=2898187 RepID=A0ABX7XFN6_9FLAO|nr:polysaccharide pyruvyl transferase family protein [Faecalibacter bovis]QTV06632.1 polysaccharide pyruvyl transferase family protein [Faecalibacter bovis]